MTDARFPDRWLTDRRFILLSGDAFKLYGIALMWCVDNRTDGFLDERDLPCLPGVLLARMGELEEARLLNRRSGGWTFTDFKKTQTGRKELERADEKREEDRQRKARERELQREAKQAAASSESSSAAPPTEVPADVQTDTAHGRPSGPSRQGDARRREATPPLNSSRDEEELPRTHAREESQTCAHCEQPSSFQLVGGFCRRERCVNDRKKAA